MYALFDIGGTKTRVALSKDLKQFDAPIKYDTPSLFDEGIEKLAATIEELSGGDTVTACAGGVRGMLNSERTVIEHDTILTDWVGKQFDVFLTEKLGAPVYIENDTALVGLGEAHYGAGSTDSIMVYHTVSSGVGGVRIVNGAIAPSEDGFEPGHQVLDMDRSILGSDVPHTLENLISGPSLEKRTGKKPYNIPQNDPVWKEFAKYLAFGLQNTILYWSPERIVLGGSMMVGDPRIDIEDVRKYLTEILGNGIDMPEIVLAELEDKGGLYGSMVFLTQKMA